MANCFRHQSWPWSLSSSLSSSSKPESPELLRLMHQQQCTGTRAVFCTLKARAYRTPFAARSTARRTCVRYERHKSGCQCDLAHATTRLRRRRLQQLCTRISSFSLSLCSSSAVCVCVCEYMSASWLTGSIAAHRPRRRSRMENSSSSGALVCEYVRQAEIRASAQVQGMRANACQPAAETPGIPMHYTSIHIKRL